MNQLKMIAILTLCAVFTFWIHASADDQQRTSQINVLVFSKTAGYRHQSIGAGIQALRENAKPNQMKLSFTEDSSVFSNKSLTAFDVVVFLNTTGDVLNDQQQVAFESFIKTGGGYVGVHAAADTEYEWPWYGKLVGAYFKSHPRVQEASVIIEITDHPSTRHLPVHWKRTDEWYNYRTNPRSYATVLAHLDTSSYEGSAMIEDHPIAWCHEYKGGRSWYTGGGHTDASFQDPAFMKHLMGGIRWAAGG